MFAAWLIAAAISGAPPHTSQSLRWLLDVTPVEVRLGDVLFVRLSVENRAREAIPVPASCSLELGMLHLKLYDPEEHTSYTFKPDGCPIGDRGQPIVLGCGKTHIVSLVMIPLPRLDRMLYRFWNPVHWRRGHYWLTAECAGVSNAPLVEILIERRPDEEMAGLLKSHEGGWRAPIPPGWETHRPSLGTFYLLSFPMGTSTPEKLAVLDKTLSPGSLRDIVRATRLTQAVFDTKDFPAKRGATAQLLQWLDAQPEVERQWMTVQLNSWGASNRDLGEFHAEFMDEIISRLPDNYGPGNYRDYFRKQYILDNPAYGKYLRNRGK